MGIAIEAPRGGLAETLAGAPRVLVLRWGEVERFEARHRGIYAVWDGFQGRDIKPTSQEVRDLLALGLVGGGMADKDADEVLSRVGIDEGLSLYAMAQALLGVAFLPNLAEGDKTGGEGGAKK